MRTSRSWNLSVVLIGLITLAVIAAVVITRVQSNDNASLQERVLSIAAELHAPGDENTITVANSALDTAQHMRYEIQQDLLAGMSRKDVLNAMQREYGPNVYAAPPARGFGTMVWLVPGVFLLILLCAAWIFLHRTLREPWQRGRETVSTTASPEQVQDENDSLTEQRVRDYL